MFAHVVAAGIDPDGVVDDAVDDRVGVDAGAEALTPVTLQILGAEDGRGFPVAASISSRSTPRIDSAGRSNSQSWRTRSADAV